MIFLLGWWIIISYDLFELSLTLLALAHWVMLLSSSGISDEFVAGILSNKYFTRQIFYQRFLSG